VAFIISLFVSVMKALSRGMAGRIEWELLIPAFLILSVGGYFLMAGFTLWIARTCGRQPSYRWCLNLIGLIQTPRAVFILLANLVGWTLPTWSSSETGVMVLALISTFLAIYMLVLYVWAIRLLFKNEDLESVNVKTNPVATWDP
jgi:hypothetical protein